MEQVEEIGLSSFAGEGVGSELRSSDDRDFDGVRATREDAVATRSHAGERPLPKWLVPSILIHLAFVIVFLASAYLVRDRLEILSQGSRSEVEHMKVWTERTGALQGEAALLRGEVENLRHYLLSSATEDVIFLKALILKPDIDPELGRIIAKNVRRYSELYGRDSNLVLAMIAVESRFDPKAVSPMGAVGLMQVMPQWKKVLGITGDLSDPEVSIKHGLQILGFYGEMYKDLEMALTAYNRGPGPVDWALMRGQDPKNKYAPRVLQTYERLKKLSVAAGS